jgi:hypothetical protein
VLFAIHRGDQHIVDRRAEPVADNVAQPVFGVHQNRMDVLVAKQRHSRPAGHHIVGHAGNLVLLQQVALHHRAFTAQVGKHRIGVGGCLAGIAIGHQRIVGNHLVKRIKGSAGHVSGSVGNAGLIAHVQSSCPANLSEDMFVLSA